MTLSRMIAPALLAVALVAPASASTAATAAPSPSADGEVLTYTARQGTVNLLNLGSEAKLPGAPAEFRSFARQSLRKSWQGYFEGKPACKGVPSLQVTALRTDGFALGNAGDRPRPGCQAGGGYVAFWAIRNGAWKQVIGTQDVPTCQRLEKLDFPSELGVDQCYDGTDVVAYVHD